MQLSHRTQTFLRTGDAGADSNKSLRPMVLTELRSYLLGVQREAPKNSTRPSAALTDFLKTGDIPKSGKDVRSLMDECRSVLGQIANENRPAQDGPTGADALAAMRELEASAAALKAQKASYAKPSTTPAPASTAPAAMAKPAPKVSTSTAPAPAPSTASPKILSHLKLVEASFAHALNPTAHAAPTANRPTKPLTALQKVQQAFQRQAEAKAAKK